VTIHPQCVQIAMVPRRRQPVWPRCGALAACLLLVACTPRLEKPVLTVAKIEYQGGNLLQQDFQISFNVHNPNARALPVSGIEARLSVDGDLIASGASSRAFIVPAQGDGQFDMTVHADMATGLIKLLGHSDALNYELAGTVSLDLAFWRSLSFHQNGVLPLRQAAH
jgi:LEA14-like dessication related protein